MRPVAVSHLAHRLQARLLGQGDALVTGVAIDSRTVRQGDLFVALGGERTDGHDHVAQAREGGAVAALVGRTVADPLPQLLVAEPLSTLQQLASQERLAAPYRLVAITGSLGKTTTKEFLAALLATTFSVGATRGSRNSQAGFPAELCNQPAGIDWMVAELGMNHAGELDRLGAIARPDAVLYTVVAPVHIEFFADIEGIAEAKAELIPHLDPAGLLVVNDRDPRVAAFRGRFAGPTRGYGDPGRSDLWIDAHESRGLLGARFSLRGSGALMDVEWEIAGRHQAENLMAAATCALALGVAPDAIAARAAALRPASRRGEVHRRPDGVTIVDDSYNSSPRAALQLLEMLAETPGRRVAVMGEMLELGESSHELHREVGARVGEVAEVVVAVGGDSAALLASAAGPRALHLPDAPIALARLREMVTAGDVVLVKGSRGIGLELVVDGLLEAA